MANKIDFKETLWKSADKLRNQMDAAEYKHIVLGLIFLKYISDTFEIQKNKIKQMVSDKKSDLFISENPEIYEKELEDRDYYTQDNVFWVPQKARWKILRGQAKQPDIGSIIDKAMIEIENSNKSLQGKLDKRFGRTQLEDGKLGELIDLISTIGFVDEHNASDLLGEVYEYFLGNFAIAEGKKGGQFYTPSHVVKTLVSILSPFKGRIYDPCCGSGGMFVQSQEFIKFHGGKVDDVSIYGQESNPTTWRLAAMNLALRGFSADIGKSNADTFSNDQFPDQKFDFILANPHFNDSDWGGEKFENDPRWVFGRPPTGNANYAWLQHILWKLKPNGRAGVILANGSLTSDNGGEQNIRKNMIEKGVVDLIVLLPAKLFINTNISVCMWFLKNIKDKNNRNDEILFIDARKLAIQDPNKRTQNLINDEGIKKITEEYNKWKNNGNFYSQNNFSKNVRITKIKEKNFTLNPLSYIEYSKDISQKKDNQTSQIQHLLDEYNILQKKNNQLGDELYSIIKKISN